MGESLGFKSLTHARNRDLGWPRLGFRDQGSSGLGVVACFEVRRTAMPLYIPCGVPCDFEPKPYTLIPVP